MNNRGLYRDTVNGRIGGVCAGVANYFQMEVWIVRLAVISFAILGGFSIVVVVYIALSLMLEKQSSVDDDHRSAQRDYALKDRPWKQGQTATQLLNHLEEDFDKMELEVRKMEAYVTSPAFSVNRKFRDL